MADRLPKAVRDALKTLEPRVRKAFLDAVKGITRAADVNAVVRALEAGDIEGAIRAMRFEVTLFGPLDRSLEESYRTAGIDMLAALPIIRDPYDGGRIAIGFDGRHPRAERWARQISGGLIGEIAEDQRQMAREAIYKGIERGLSPRKTALDIIGRVNFTTGRREGGLIGLSSKQVQWVRNAELQLRNGSYSDYLRHKLRNKTYDRMVIRAMQSGKPLTASQIAKISGAYRRNVLRYRGETIARTETLNAYRAGNMEGFRQLVDSGAVRNDQIRRIWSDTGDGRTRPHHMAMNTQEITGLDMPWNVNGSLMMFPGDVSMGASADQIVNCRCWQNIRIDYDPE